MAVAFCVLGLLTRVLFEQIGRMPLLGLAAAVFAVAELLTSPTGTCADPVEVAPDWHPVRRTAISAVPAHRSRRRTAVVLRMPSFTWSSGPARRSRKRHVDAAITTRICHRPGADDLPLAQRVELHVELRAGNG
jgi:hypothetical protein